ncbi:solute carrier family 17 member 9 isoform X11 [Nycticebus coucang]|uniref:solute carrier family 17 member 9 isoform X11 n=1 Tax=Nycticebus coucang TaxID=9470 RepID=UPI00234DDDA8|nr:solute carrier family 17 member 9 isoform X11 [Nycticebus coucang]
MKLPLDEAGKDMAENTQWSRPECQTWTVALLLGTCLLYCTRMSVPICTVAMSQDFGWNKKEAGIVLSSFFWGYCLTQVVGGHLGDRIGGEKVIMLSASAWGSITAATPLFSHLGSAHLIYVTLFRVLMGLLQGVYFPALTSLLSQKVQESERALTYSTVSAGSQIGTLVTGAVGSVLLEWCGWPSVFYLSGGLTLLWVWCMHRYRSGHGHPGARPASVQALQGTLETALPKAFCLGWVFNVVPWLVAIPASVFSGLLSDHLICQAMLGGTHSRGHGGLQQADRTPLWPPPIRLQSCHGAEVHAGRRSCLLCSQSPRSPDSWGSCWRVPQVRAGKRRLFLAVFAVVGPLHR